jgi:6-phosphogluconolactonase (cycloisomerase 2 family)
MSRAATRALAPLILAACLLCSLSCKNPFSSFKHSDKTASLAVSLSAQTSRSVVAGGSDYLGAIAAYKVTVTNMDHSYEGQTTGTGGCTINNIIAGTYKIQVDAYSEVGCTVKIASGQIASATLDVGATTSVPVALSFFQTAGVYTGGFKLKVQWPASTGLRYVSASLETAQAVTAADLDTSADPYTATLSATGLQSGVHTLQISFKASSSATTTIGPYVETVNIWDGVISTLWSDSSDTPKEALTLDPSEFANTSAALASSAGLVVDTLGLASSYSPGTYVYNFGATPTIGASYTFSIAAASASQGIACTFNGSTVALTATSPTTFTGGFTAGFGGNTLKVAVTAPDKTTTVTYSASITATGYAYVTNSSSNTVTAYAIGLGGGLAYVNDTLSASSYATGSNPWASAISGSYLFTGADSSTVTAYAIGSGGELSTIGSYATSSYILGIATSGSYLYAVGGNKVTAYAIGTGGALTTAGSYATGSTPVAIAISGGYLYVANKTGSTVTAYAIGSGGELSYIAGTLSASSYATGSSPYDVAIAGNYLYAANFDSNTVTAFTIGSDGSLATVGSYATGAMPFGIAIVGSYLYVANYGSNTVTAFTIGSGGALATVGSYTTGSNPRALAIIGSYLYVANFTDSTLTAYAIGSGGALAYANGSLSASSLAAGSAPKDIAVYP